MCVASLVSKDILPPKFQFHANQTHVHCCLRSSRKSQRQRVVWFSTVQFSLMRVYIWIFHPFSPDTTALQLSYDFRTLIHPSDVLHSRHYITQHCETYSIKNTDSYSCPIHSRFSFIFHCIKPND